MPASPCRSLGTESLHDPAEARPQQLRPQSVAARSATPRVASPATAPPAGPGSGPLPQHGSLHRGMPGSALIQLQRLIAIGQQRLHIPQPQWLQRQRIAEYRADLGMGLDHPCARHRWCPPRSDATRRAGGLDRECPATDPPLAHHPMAIQQQRLRRRGQAFALATTSPKAEGRHCEPATTQADAAHQLLGGLHLRARRHQPIPGRPATALARKRVVLWYDPNGEWDSEFDDDQPAAAE